MSESLAFDIFAIDRASAVFEKVAGKGEEMSSRLGKAARIAGAVVAGIGVAAAGVALEVGKIGFEEFTKNQAAVAQLDAVIKSTGSSAGVTSEQVQKLGDKIQGYSGQTHESVDAAATLLLQFGNIKDVAGPMGDVLDRATTLTADIAARMGGSASDSAVKLGRALTDPTKGLTALTRMGVTFTVAQKSQIKAMQDSGNLMGAQNLVLDALTTRYGGAAKAAGETLPGQLNRAKLAFEDVAASIVAKLIPVITTLIGFINDRILPAFQKVYDVVGVKLKAVFADLRQPIEAFKEALNGTLEFPVNQYTGLGRVLATVGVAFRDIAAFVTGTIIPMFQSLGDFVAGHATLFKSLAVAVGAMVVVWETYQAVMTVVRVVSEAFAAVQAAVNVVLNANPIGIIIIALAGLAAGFIYAYKHSETFRDTVQGVMRAVSNAFHDFMDVVKTVFDFITDHWQAILAVVFGPMGLMIDLIADHWTGFKQIVMDAWDVVRDTISDVWKVIKPILDAMKQAIEDTVGAVGKVVGAVGKVTGGVGKVAGGIGKALGFAGGTTNAPGGPAWVGENGPELVNLARGSSVTPAGASSAAVGNGTGDIHITLTLQDGTALHKLIIPAAQLYKKRNGGFF